MPRPLLVFSGSTPDKAVHHFHIDHYNAPCLPTHPPSEILHNHCLGFLLGQLLHPGEIGNNGYAKFSGRCGGVNKKHYGLCESSELKIGQEVLYTGLNHLQVVNKLSLMDKQLSKRPESLTHGFSAVIIYHLKLDDIKHFWRLKGMEDLDLYITFKCHGITK